MKLGSNQRHILRSIREFGYWYPGCGWIWSNRSETIRLLDTLVKRGLVRKAPKGYEPIFSDFVMVRSNNGDGGWSLHAPNSTDDAIANGEARPLASGSAVQRTDGTWSRPNRMDYTAAQTAYDKEVP